MTSAREDGDGAREAADEIKLMAQTVAFYRGRGYLVTCDDEGRIHADGDEPAVRYRSQVEILIAEAGGMFVKDFRGELAWPPFTSIWGEWWVHGKQHRDGDKPAVVQSDTGDWEWWVHGKQHRDGDKPAFVTHDGTQEWWVNGRKHRDGDEPAVVEASGRREWWKEGKQHREGGKAAVDFTRWRENFIDYDTGPCEWWEDNKLHREDGPAMELAHDPDDPYPPRGRYFLRGVEIPSWGEHRVRVQLMHLKPEGVNLNNDQAWKFLADSGSLDLDKGTFDEACVPLTLIACPNP